MSATIIVISIHNLWDGSCRQ